MLLCETAQYRCDEDSDLVDRVEDPDSVLRQQVPLTV